MEPGSKPGEGFLITSFDRWAGEAVSNPPGVMPMRPDPVIAAVAEIQALRAVVIELLKLCPRCKGKRMYRGKPCKDCLPYVQVLAKGTGS